MSNTSPNTLNLDTHRISRAQKHAAQSAALFARVQGRVQDFAKNPKHHTKSLFRRLCFLCRVLGDPRAPWTAKLAAGLSVGYVLSPIQLIPSFIPIIGQVDDLLAIWLGMKLVRKLTPTAVLVKHLRRMEDGIA